MKSFGDFSAVAKRLMWLQGMLWRGLTKQDEDLNLQLQTLTRGNGLLAGLLNSPTDFYPRITATNFCLTHQPKLPTFHGLYVFTGRPHKFYILIFVKISARDHNCVKAAQ